jgi:hypothetical protein
MMMAWKEREKEEAISTKLRMIFFSFASDFTKLVLYKTIAITKTFRTQLLDATQ